MSTEPIDLRSDTVTRPSAGMRRAMAEAEVGDDVFGDDPTVNRLQAQLAERLGYEAGLFMASGTQGNLSALMAHCARGDEVILGQNAHTYKYEGGGVAVLGSIQPQPLEHAADGSIPLNKIAAAIKADDVHFARTRLLALENTIGGKAVPLAYCKQATSFAHGRGLSTHLDGARFFNAVAALGCSERDLAGGFDSASICLSKGLGAPVGSVLLGTKELIARARRVRKMLGGGLRQAGVLAAAGLYALEHNVARLPQDHAHAQQLAEGLRGCGLQVDGPYTNMVFAHISDDCAGKLVAWLAARGIHIIAGTHLRLVTHLDVDDAGIERTIAAFRDFFVQNCGSSRCC
jgi:threonine aldolase